MPIQPVSDVLSVVVSVFVLLLQVGHYYVVEAIAQKRKGFMELEWIVGVFKEVCESC
jgi:hypothetical protein